MKICRFFKLLYYNDVVVFCEARKSVQNLSRAYKTTNIYNVLLYIIVYY